MMRFIEGKLWRMLGGLILLGLSFGASAQLTVEIAGGRVSNIPIMISAFAGENQLMEPLTAIIKSDLEMSGLFRVETTGILPHDATIPEPERWKAGGIEALVTGVVQRNADGTFDVAFRLFNTINDTQLAAQGFRFTPKQTRATAHRIADVIYTTLTGEVGVFSTRIAYVVNTGNSYALQVADVDGHNMQAVIRSTESLMSPVWSPDGTKVAYVSFEKKKPMIYVQSLSDGRREVIANYKGSNSSPAWSPDGRQLAIVLTKDGQQQIYLVNANGSNLRRLTRSNAADTEPVFSPDGSTIYFTSDRGGSPQIYRMSASGGPAQRVTFSGNYNAGPRISPDGRYLAYVTTSGGGYQVAVMDLASGQSHLLGQATGAERPTFSPNGRMVLFAAKADGRDVLIIASVDGNTRQKLSLPAGKVREPAWGPIQIQ